MKEANGETLGETLGAVSANAASDRHYTIIVDGHIDDHWQEWFPDMALIRLPDGLTRMTGVVIDQSALHGMLSRIRDLGLPLLLVLRGNFARK